MEIVMRKILLRTFIIFTIVAAFGFFACGRSGSKPVTVTLLLLGNKPANGRAEAAIAEINKITSERIGAVLQTQYIEWTDWQSQYQLAMATGNTEIDLVITGDWLEVWRIVQRGGFYPLTPELLQTNAPKTWEAIPASHWEVCSKDGKIWFIPEDQFSQFTNHGMFWRKDWAREGGLEDIAKFEDLEKYWDIVKVNHPEAFPWDVSGMGQYSPHFFYGYIQGKLPVQMIMDVHLFHYDVNDPYTAISFLMEGDELIEAARLFDRWSKKGFWRTDMLNYTGDTGNLFIAGLSGSNAHHTNSYIEMRATMDREQPGSEIQMFYYGKENGNVNRDLIYHGAMAINGASRNVEKALRMYDLLRNDKQIYLLYNYGIEGRDYIVNSDGTFSQPPGFNPVTDGLGTNFWGGRMDEFEPVWDTWWSGRKAFLEYIGSIAQDYPLSKFVFDNSKVSAELAAINDVMTIHIPALQFGKTNNPDKAVADFRTALRQAGYERVRAELQSQLDVFKTQL